MLNSVEYLNSLQVEPPLWGLTCLGVDPGIKGGLVISSKAHGVLLAVPMPVSNKEVNAKAIRLILEEYKPDIAIIEEVHAMPGQGVTSMFQFGKMYGGILSLVRAHCDHVFTVRPQKWKGEVLSGTLKDKQAAVDYCGDKYPNLNLIQPRCRTPHDGIADAVCMADYGLYHLIKETKE